MKLRLSLLAAVLLVVTTLTACDGIPASPTPRDVNGVTIVDNPAYMNDNNLGILRYWWTYTHNPAIAAQADSLNVASSNVPDNVAMAQAAWFEGEPGTRQNVACAVGVLFSGAAVVFTVANPPATLAMTAAAWFITGGSAALSLNDCWDTFQWSPKDDAQPRWLADCTAAYLTDGDWNMLNPAWEHSDDIKFQRCLVFGWVAARAIAAGIGERGNNDIVTLRGNYVCNVIIFPPGLECHWE